MAGISAPALRVATTSADDLRQLGHVITPRQEGRCAMALMLVTSCHATESRVIVHGHIGG